jgi:hypothetical protein
MDGGHTCIAERCQQGRNPANRVGVVAPCACCPDLVDAALDVDHRESCGQEPSLGYIVGSGAVAARIVIAAQQGP